jgi:hypothetical protein
MYMWLGPSLFFVFSGAAPLLLPSVQSLMAVGWLFPLSPDK